MSAPGSLALGSSAIGLLALAASVTASCGSAQTSSTGDAGRPRDSGSSPDAALEGSCGPGCYAPQGCAYEVSPPESAARALGYTDFTVDTSSPVGSVAGATPLRVRLGLGGGTTAGQTGYADPTKTVVMTWETAAKDGNAKVKLGKTRTSLTDVHAGYAWTTPPGVGAVAYMHEVHVCGLEPATTYYYEVGGGAPGKEVWSATQSFTTVPATGPVTIGVFGDSRDSVTIWQIVHQRMKSHAVSLDLISGDVVFFGPLEAQWSSWLDAIWKDGSGGFLTLGEQLMVPIAGNHEAESADFYGNFSLPGTGDWAETYASFNVGNTHVVMLDDSPLAAAPSASSLSPEARAQIAWLNADLAAADADRAAHPFVVVVSHRGMYSTSDHSADPDVLVVRSVLAPIYDRYHVDLAMNGHDHEYERSYPLNANASNPASNAAVLQKTDPSKGTVYVTNAGAGAAAYAIHSEVEAYDAFSWGFGPPTKYVGCYGILALKGRTLELTEYGIKGAASADDVIDTFTLSR